MSFILVPNDGQDVQINAWNWRPTIALLRHANLIDDRQHGLMGCNGCGARVDSATAIAIAEFLNQQLEKMILDQRLRGDLTITSSPKKPAVFTPNSKLEDFEAVEIYSATYQWLIRSRDFCRTSQGFEVS